MTARSFAWPPAVAAIVFNLVPIMGVLFWGWSAFALIFLYWAENIVVGARTLGMMIATAFLSPKASPAAIIGIGPFFVVHYGIFCFVHGGFVVAMFGDSKLGYGDAFNLVGAAQAVIAHYPGIAYGLISIAMWQGMQLALYLLRGEARQGDLMTLMASPYPRIFILHMTIIFGGGLVMMLGEPTAGLVLMSLIKAAFDVADTQGLVLVRFGARSVRD